MDVLNKGSEVLIRINTGVDIQKITTLELSYYTDPSNKILCSLTNGKIINLDNTLCAKLDSTDTNNFSGIMRCDMVVGWISTVYSDSEQEIRQTKYTTIKWM